MTRGGALMRLALRFPLEAIRSGWSTALLIVARRPLAPGFVELPYGALTETGAALLAALVTLTPGTTVVDIDVDRRTFRVHVLDAARADVIVAGIESAFLRPATVLFGREA